MKHCCCNKKCCNTMCNRQGQQGLNRLHAITVLFPWVLKYWAAILGLHVCIAGVAGPYYRNTIPMDTSFGQPGSCEATMHSNASSGHKATTRVSEKHPILDRRQKYCMLKVWKKAFDVLLSAISFQTIHKQRRERPSELVMVFKCFAGWVAVV